MPSQVSTRDELFDSWIGQLEERYLAELTFSEISRALRALSSLYVENRARLDAGGALSGNGKRAAFALFYGPLHYLLVREIVRLLRNATSNVRSIVDLGCGTGASGAAWASACPSRPRVIGIDRHPWALGEASRTYRGFGLTASVRRGNITTAPLTGRAFVAGFALNELPPAEREALLERLIQRGQSGDRVLIVEPLAGFVAPWWGRWRDRIAAAGGVADEWRFRVELPPIIAKLDRAAGLDHRELTGRSLFMGLESRPLSLKSQV